MDVITPMQAEKLGLNKSELKVYLALLRRGSATAGDLTAATGIHRRNVYDLLGRLIEKGLCSFIVQNKRKSFHPVHPASLMKLLDNRIQGLYEVRKEVEKSIPVFEGIYEKSPEKPVAKIFLGVEGLKTVLNDSLTTFKKSKENVWITIGASGLLSKLLGKGFDIFTKRRVRLGVKWRIVYNRNSVARAREFAKNPLTECRIIPREYESPVILTVYENKLLIVLFSDPVIAFLVENKQVSESMKKYCEYIWKKSSEI